MSFSDWLEETKGRYNNESFSYATSESIREFYIGILRNIGKKINYGTLIWEHDWEILVILDACRYDTFYKHYYDDPDFENIEKTYSVGSASIEWILKTFSDGCPSETAYVTGNPFSEEYIDNGTIDIVNEVWREKWDDEQGTIPPEPLTDEAIRTWENENPDKMIIHYMQPHFPHVSSPITEGFELDEFGDIGGEAFELLRRGEITKSEAIAVYESNLKYIIDHLKETLFRGVDANIKCTADHGNMFGEWWVYGHPTYVPFPALKRVPLVSVSEFENNYSPKPKKETNDDIDSTVDERLEDLGYKS